MRAARIAVVLLVLVVAAAAWIVLRPARDEPARAVALHVDTPSAGAPAPQLPARHIAAQPHRDPEERIRIGRQLQEDHRGFKILPAANADLTRQSLTDVVAALKRRADAGDGPAGRQLSDIYRQCAAALYAESQRLQRNKFQLRESASAPLDPAPESVAHCQGLDADAVKFFGDRLLAAAAAGDTEARLRLRSSVHAVSGGEAGIVRAQALALSYLKTLARQGDGRAWYALAEEASTGRLLPRDAVLAYAYYTGALLRASDPYDRRGIEIALQMLRQRLTPEELRRGELASREASILD